MASIIKTKAFVLNKLDFGDTSKIVNFYTEEFGRVSGIIKGARSSKSKIGKAIDVLNQVEILFYRKENRDIQVVTQAEIVSHYPSIKDDLEKLKYASAIIELTLKLTIENDPHKKLFAGINKILDRMNNEETAPSLLFAFFIRFFINEIGYGVETDYCSQCNIPLKESHEIFYNHDLGFMCDNCGKDHVITNKFSSELFDKIICLSHRNKNCSYDENEIELIINFFEKFLTYHIDEFQGLKSLKIY